MKITKLTKEEQQIKEEIERSYMKSRLNKLIGEMATFDLRILYDDLIWNHSAPTAEELVKKS